MKAIKGLLIYIGIVLGGIVGLALILLCVMYFVPSFRIAGIGVIHNNKEIEEETISLSGYDDVVINLSSGKIDVHIVPAEISDITYSMKLGVFGISTEIVEYKVVKHIETQVVESVDGDKRVLQVFLNISEPKGWINCSNSRLIVNVPTTQEIGVVAKTNRGNVVIGHESFNTLLNELTVNTNNGDLNLINLGVGAEEKSLTLNTLSLTTNNGVFDLRSINKLTVLNKTRLTANDGEFKFDKLYSSVDVTGDGVAIEAEEITCGAYGFSFVAENGIFNIGTLNGTAGAENTIIAKNLSSFKINQVYGKTGIVTTYGDINVGSFMHYTSINNENGNVSVKVANDTIIVTTKFGNINVDEYYATGKFTTDKGNIRVNSRGEFADEYYTQITSVDGDIKIYNRVNRLLLTTTGRSDVDITFGEIKTGKVFQHKINTSTQGNAIIYMPTVGVPAYSFTAKGIISGEIGVMISASEKTQYYPSASQENKSASMNNACFEFVGRIEFKGYAQLAN